MDAPGMNTFAYVDESYSRHSQKHQFVEMTALSFLGFLIPFLIGHPQLLVGVAVNALLIRSALSMPEKMAFPIIFSPSIGVLARGLLFGPLTVFVVYLMPAIWVGNLIILTAFKMKVKHNINYGLALLAGSAVKAGLLYSVAYVLYSANVIPALLLPAMGVMQFATAFGGGTLVYLWSKGE